MFTKIVKDKAEVKKEGDSFKDGRNFHWKRLEITDENGDVYTSFDERFLDVPNGTEVNVELTEESREYKGKFYHDKKIKLVTCKGCFHCEEANA